MTIDERVQALTETVGLLASMHKDNETRFNAAITEVKGAVVDIKDVMTRMSRIMQYHDLTLEDHEDRISKLERRRKPGSR